MVEQQFCNLQVVGSSPTRGSMLDKKQKGNLTELLCISEFYKLGYTVCIPYGENNRYDFIADIDGKLIRIQVKTSKSFDNGRSYNFSCQSSRTNGKRCVNKKYTESEIDYFCTMIEDVCCLIPINECSTKKTIRVQESLNNQTTHLNMVDDYKLSNQINKIINSNV